MKKWIYLSYLLNPETPTYGNAEGMSVSPLRSMDAGDTSNSSLWRIPNHTGTHVDFPRHFVADGKTGDDFPASFWLFTQVKVVRIRQAVPGMTIGPDDLTGAGLTKRTEMVLVKTGFSKYRGDDIYWKENPIILPETADFLRTQCPRVRVFGFDTISLSSYTNRPLGREAHRAFLDNPHPILPLEDMDLSGIDESTVVESVCVLPMRVENADAAPCSVIAFCSGK
jgi:kynurenine formamidase